MFSVIVPTYNAAKTLFELLVSLSSQTYRDFEIIVVDDCSTDDTAAIVSAFECNYIRLLKNSGPGCCRNRGAEAAKGDLLIFTDSDCKAAPDWLEKINGHFENNDICALMGRLVIMPSTFLGDSISGLGFPAGGAIGFDKIWRVDESGFTNSLSACNCVVRKNVFMEIGGYDEVFPFAGGEDSYLAYCLRKAGHGIKYCPDVVSYHPARSTLKGFMNWQFKRGISSFIFSQKVTGKREFLSLRIWSTKNIISHYCRDLKFPLVLILLFAGIVTQFAGYTFARCTRN